MDEWLDEHDIPDRVPFLISPSLEYDSVLNGYFLTPAMVGAAGNTQLAAAGDLCRFLNFLWAARGRASWRDATEADHVAYLYWRRNAVDQGFKNTVVAHGAALGITRHMTRRITGDTTPTWHGA
jgi:hypothetical protein